MLREIAISKGVLTKIANGHFSNKIITGIIISLKITIIINNI